MIKTTLLILLHLLVSTLTFSQWTQISQIGNNELRGVKFFNEHTGIVVGQGGIWRSTNSGVNWTNVWNISEMNAISFLDATTGLAVGVNGIIVKTTSGGLYWNITVNPTNENLFAVDWANATICWVVGFAGRILKSTSAGNNWYTQVNPLSQDLKAVFMPDPGNGYIAGGTSSELFASTVNGGANWIYSLNQPGNFINDMACPSFDRIFLVGSVGRIRRSTNFGTSWSIISSGTTQPLNSVLFVNSTDAYVVGNTGAILKSTNSGANWSFEQCPTTDNLKDVDCINTNTGWIVGSNGIVLRKGIPVWINSNEIEINDDFVLYQNIPNPFNSETSISFSLGTSGHATLSILDIAGRNVKQIINSFFQNGRYTFKINMNDMSSGIYFYELTIRSQHLYITKYKKLIFLK